jgi:AcrR family transcriptional regulator
MRKELTAKGKATRNRIVEGAAVVLRQKGVSAATLDDVMARTQTSKSQLFHYFPAGKDELLLAVAQYEADQVLEDQQPYLGCLDSWDAWQQWRNGGRQAWPPASGPCRPPGTYLPIWTSSTGPPPFWRASRAACRFSSRPAGPTTSGPRSTRGSAICAALPPEAGPARRGSRRTARRSRGASASLDY